ncbi:MAG TPA: SDR family NAD(P)-dependent oxidoreductase, partial [Myxococcota bacterium]|nr:SDR family NAD(P)-dependent oxidoreductase [Myxococcota bacterium]
MKLDSCKLIVTGAARGMGAYFATQLANAGAQVAAGDVDEAGLKALAEATKNAKGR